MLQNSHAYTHNAIKTHIMIPNVSFTCSPSPNYDKEPNGSQRNHGRLVVEELACYHNDRYFGEIIDLSPCGMRVLRSGTPKINTDDISLMSIVGCDHEIRVKTKMKWINQADPKKVLLGMEFIVPSDITQKAIRLLCQLARVDTHLGVHRKLV